MVIRKENSQLQFRFYNHRPIKSILPSHDQRVQVLMFLRFDRHIRELSHQAVKRQIFVHHCIQIISVAAFIAFAHFYHEVKKPFLPAERRVITVLKDSSITRKFFP